jgi:hypothetical protein
VLAVAWFQRKGLAAPFHILGEKGVDDDASHCFTPSGQAAPFGCQPRPFFSSLPSFSKPGSTL